TVGMTGVTSSAWVGATVGGAAAPAVPRAAGSWAVASVAAALVPAGPLPSGTTAPWTPGEEVAPAATVAPGGTAGDDGTGAAPAVRSAVSEAICSRVSGPRR